MIDKLEEKIFKMAAKEKLILPESVNNQIEVLLDSLPEKRKIRKLTFKKAVILAATLILLISMTAVASVNLFQKRMESMNQQKLAEYFDQIYKGGEAYHKNRNYTDSEQERIIQLEKSYKTEGLFPEGELRMITDSSEYKGRGVAFLARRSTFFIPDTGMTDEELLQIIDFNHKSDYSLEKMNEMIAAGEIDFPAINKEIMTPTDETILNSESIDYSTQELVIPYTGKLEITAITAGAKEIFLGGWQGIHKMQIGSGTSELFFDDLGDYNVKIDSMTQGVNGTLYVGLRKYDKNEKFLSVEVWSIDSKATVQKKLNISSIIPKSTDGINDKVITRMAVDANHYLYLRGVSNDIIMVIDTDGNLISNVKDDNYTAHRLAGVGIGKDGIAYTSLYEKSSDKAGIASIDPINGKLEQIYIGIAPQVILPLDVVAPGTEGDFILWGYNGIFTYNQGEREAKQIMAAYEAPFQWEGCIATALPDGRIMFCITSELTEKITANGTTQFRRNPETTTFLYTPLLESKQH